jgi:hypothetical protein
VTHICLILRKASVSFQHILPPLEDNIQEEDERGGYLHEREEDVTPATMYPRVLLLFQLDFMTLSFGPGNVSN